MKEESIKNENRKGAIEKAKTKTKRREIMSLQKSVINNAVIMHDKRGIFIDVFINKFILPGDLEKDVYLDNELRYDESISKRTKMRI